MKSSKATSRVTQALIAKNLNVDQSTVSACLNGTPRAQRFTAELRKRIQDEADRLNYRPNFFASQLRSEHPKMIVLGLNSLNDPHSAQLADAIAERTEELGYRVLVSPFNRMKNPGENIRDIIGPHGLKALCLIGSAVNIFPQAEFSKLLDEGVHIALVLRSHPDPRMISVAVDEEYSGRMAYEYFHARGLRNLWVLHDDSPVVAESVGVRAPAFVEAARLAGAPEPLMITARQGVASEGYVQGYQEVKSMLATHQPPEGFFAVHDLHAYGAIRAFQEAGLQVGRDVSVIGHDDLWPSSLLWPNLTTVRQPMRRIGSLAAEMLIESLQEVKMGGRRMKFRADMVERSSVVTKPSQITAGGV